MTGRLLVAGIGNIFLSDDGFGVEVVNRLAGADLPDWVRVADYGIRGMHLAYDLANGYDSAILVDATPRGGEPGTVYVIEPERRPATAAAAEGSQAHGSQAHGSQADSSQADSSQADSSQADSSQADGSQVGGSPLFDAHGMQPDVVLGVLDMLGAEARPLLVVGCEPASVDYGMGLSAPVAAAVDEAVRVVIDLVASAGPGQLGQQYRAAVTAGQQAGDQAGPGGAAPTKQPGERTLPQPEAAQTQVAVSDGLPE